MGDRLLSAAEWAAQVDPGEAHGLAEVEDHVLGRDSASAVHLTAASRSSLRDALTMVVGLAALAGPVAAATVWFDRSGQRRLDYDFSNEFSYPASAIGMALGMVLLLSGLVEWARGDRRRDLFMAGAAAAVTLCGVLVLLQARGESLRGDVPAWVYLVPVWAAVGGGVLVAGVGILSPAGDRGEAARRKGRDRLHAAKVSAFFQDVDDLPAVYVEALQRDRREALEILRDRGMLSRSVSIDELAGRPLGRLAPDDRQGA